MTDSEVVFPARAGMIRNRSISLYRSARIPRESGDDPTLLTFGKPGMGYSPRERG